MKKTSSKKRSAFSLIELSIVLIIIGLLIAGITGGASLIKSSELRAVMGEARGYAVAVNAFYTQFNALPGDFGTSLGTAAGGSVTMGGNAFGDGDSKIEYCTSCSTTAATATGSESAIAWQHLKFAGAIDVAPTFQAAGVAAQTAGTHFPASKIKAAGWNFDYNTATGSLQNVVVLTGSTTSAGTSDANSLVNGATMSTAAILPTDALSIDSKIDDGVANTGKVRAVNPANGTGCAGGTATVPSASYTVATTTKACALSYQIDVNS